MDVVWFCELELSLRQTNEAFTMWVFEMASWGSSWTSISIPREAVSGRMKWRETVWIYARYPLGSGNDQTMRRACSARLASTSFFCQSRSPCLQLSCFGNVFRARKQSTPHDLVFLFSLAPQSPVLVCNCFSFMALRSRFRASQRCNTFPFPN